MTPHSSGRRLALFAALLAAVAAAALLSLMVGRQPLSPATVLHALAPHSTGAAADIVRGLRLERTVVAVAVGLALGGAGALMQALTRNPLADPGLLGVNAGAAAAVVTGFALFGISGRYPQMWLALGGAAAASVVVYLIGSGGRSGATPARLALAGAALSAVLLAYINALALRDQRSYDTMRFWVAGSVVNRGLDTLVAALPFLVVGTVLALLLTPGLNALALGDDRGRALGVRVGLVRVLTAAAVTLLCGAATAVAGPIGFLGLTVPHIVRFLVGPDQRAVVPMSMLLSAALLVLADTAGRVIGTGREIEAGIMTAILGAPVFIALVRRRKLVAL
ncbi:FecCD family ABC transporter permease [Gryllotalpicola ginsengisoli]|uniref:FecCD family ABC transporter permease n=1 Tax=Gryllotalpicola ginsengisoli TaxID=444608 RepID=UPI0003B62BBB|nr:iron chelate uptake ABC transporter family permease subunit [Gryllotalpicola ginsengisoli]